MSSEIEYRHLALAFEMKDMANRWNQVTGNQYNDAEGKIFVVLAESGSSNTTQQKWINGRWKEVLEKDWEIAAVGSEYDVIAHACRLTPFVHSGMTKLRCAGRSGEVSPEAYIRHYRNTLAQAVDGTATCQIGGRQIRFTDPLNVADRCPWMAKAKESGRLTAEPKPFGLDGETRAVLRLSGSNADGSLACDLYALSKVFSTQGRDYPHFDFHDQAIDGDADRAYAEMVIRRKFAA